MSERISDAHRSVMRGYQHMRQSAHAREVPSSLHALDASKHGCGDTIQRIDPSIEQTVALGGDRLETASTPGTTSATSRLKAMLYHSVGPATVMCGFIGLFVVGHRWPFHYRCYVPFQACSSSASLPVCSVSGRSTLAWWSYGVPASQVMNLVRSLGSRHVGEVFEGQLRFPLIIRLPEETRNSPEQIGDMLVATATAQRIPLSRLTDIEQVDAPSTIRREWYQRRITIEANVRGRDMGSFVAEAQQAVDQGVSLPQGRYRVEWGGQFENLQQAQTRLMIVVPIALLLIFSLLYMTYGNWLDTLRVFTGVPFAWVGGVIALWVRDMPFSISAAIGFIALSGVAVLDDMLLVSTIRQLLRRGLSLDTAVEQAAMTRLRPILMTTLVASLGFVPMAVSTGMGAEVQRPLATVVIGGVCSAMVMSLLVLRVLYVVFNLPLGTKPNTAKTPLNRLSRSRSESP